MKLIKIEDLNYIVYTDSNGKKYRTGPNEDIGIVWDEEYPNEEWQPIYESDKIIELQTAYENHVCSRA